MGRGGVQKKWRVSVFSQVSVITDGPLQHLPSGSSGTLKNQVTWYSMYSFQLYLLGIYLFSRTHCEGKKPLQHLGSTQTVQ